MVHAQEGEWPVSSGQGASLHLLVVSSRFSQEPYSSPSAIVYAACCELSSSTCSLIPSVHSAHNLWVMWLLVSHVSRLHLSLLRCAMGLPTALTL